MPRVFSGIQPSGELHIGNYLGAVKNWVALQDRYECFICIVDLHAITQPYEAAELEERTLEMATGLLAAGIDPARSVLFVQSHVPAHAELMWLLNYPILQAADILLYKAEKVPVGEDQVQHLELAREVARRFNSRYRVQLFPEPQPMLTSAARIVGLDGQAKMSKSLGNTIGLLDSAEAVWEKLRPAMTDPARKTRKDPGNPDVCNIYTLHQHFSSEAEIARVAERCRWAGWGCLDCKRGLADNIVAALAPIRERAAALKADPGSVRQVLADGARRARHEAQRTMDEVSRIMGFLPPAM